MRLPDPVARTCARCGCRDEVIPPVEGIDWLHAYEHADLARCVELLKAKVRALQGTQR